MNSHETSMSYAGPLVYKLKKKKKHRFHLNQANQNIHMQKPCL